MTPERWRHVKQVLQSALELEPEQQAEFVASACVGDEPLRLEVESLLEYQKEGASFIEVSAADVAAKILADEEAHSAIGRRLGPYKIVREIGQGGMGSVYLAVRDDAQYQQKVALKLVKRGMDTDFILRRFRHERQILADLNHPNIARLLDGGTSDDGLPYFVMEYVEGVPIDQYVHEHELTTVERLKLFSVTCAAVHYAHQHLVVHRDIKPGNILVTADGNPKLLDFGIAKLLHDDHGSPATNVTATAVRLMTPEYASPEQLRGLSVSTATDIYSLGVLLYEILTGHRPYRFEGRLPHEVAQVICEQEPEKPSHAVSRAQEAVAAEGSERAHLSAAPIRNIHDGQPEKLRRTLRGDLDNIVLMAMRKEPERRYASVEQFAEDIRRHLEGLPVRARADTFGYRGGKFVTRHKLAVVAATLVLVTLLAGIVATTWQARVARLERERAERRFNEVRQLANSFVFDVHDAIHNLPGSTKARALIVQQALKYLDSLAQEAGGDLTLQRELAAAYEKLGLVQNTPTIAHLGDIAGAMQSHRKAAAVREALVAADPGNLDYRRELLDS
ncbi:MAG TPA: serine/threonine-protein kinase, partial [Pyrinomonadaceae bacterium]|nr:serine/threonine-protein kinase [Pyrinomonadaceae bacterium]